MKKLRILIERFKYRDKRNLILTSICVVFALVIIGVAVVDYKYVETKYRAEELAKQAQIDEQQQAEEENKYADIVENKNSALKPKTKEGYTSYIVKYKTKEGQNLDISNTFQFISDSDNNIWFNVTEAQSNGLLGEYYDENGDYYFQLKNGSNFVWQINPKDTTTVSNWSPSKENSTIAVKSTDQTNEKMVVETVIVDYESKDTTELTYYEEMIAK